MSERDRTKSLSSEKAVLVGVFLADEEKPDEELVELQGLADTAGCQVVARLTQRREQPNANSYLGSGKVAELAMLVDATEADVVVFDNDLSPTQTKSLEEATKVKVIDRTELILDIFASHARTYEARLAVELAQLEYSLPRLKRMWTHLSRLKMGVGMRGPGEKQLEVDRRLVEKRIFDLRTDLQKIERRREREVAARDGHMTVSLVGYTNAGKSTLMNRLTQADVLAADQLFATLDTRTRRWHLPNWGPVLLSDTVGFIRHLPHRLIASFKATLEETRQADLLLHVCDASNPAVVEQISAVFGVLRELDIEEKDLVLVINKIDADPDRTGVESVLRRYPHGVPVSAGTGEGIPRLMAVVSEALSHSFADLDIETSVSNGRLLAYLAAHGEVLSQSYDGERVLIHCRMPQKHAGRIHDADTVVRDRRTGKALWDPSAPDTELAPPRSAQRDATFGDVA